MEFVAARFEIVVEAKEMLGSLAVSLTMSGWPKTWSAPAPLAVGMLLKMRTRSLPPSAINSRVPSESAYRGRERVFSQRGEYVGLPFESVPVEAHTPGELLSAADVISGCPTTRFAGWSFDVGKPFQIKTRLKPVSVTYKWPASAVTEVGLQRRFAEAVTGPF